jgi:photosystem II stability/assembly factor-like uncharacterized protein
MMKMSAGWVAALAAVPVILALGAGGALAQPASGNPPPPKGFEADSVSFVTARTGFVLGARGCSRMPCRALLAETANGGKTWNSAPVPKVSLVPPFTGSPRSAVSEVRFASASDGWLFGPGLWATTDGGAKWRSESLPGEVIALASADGAVYAATEPVNGGFNQAKLYRSQVGGTKWTLVRGVSPGNALTVHGHSVWAGIAPALWTSTDTGKHWARLSFHCPKADISASAVAAASTADVAIACSDQGFPQPGFSTKEVFTSANGGRTFHLVGQPPEPGQVGTLAMPPGHPQVITMTATSGASYFYRSVNGGKTWQTTTYFDGGLSFRDFAYVSATTGYVIHFNGGPVIAYGQGLLKSADAGANWKTIAIP